MIRLDHIYVLNEKCQIIVLNGNLYKHSVGKYNRKAQQPTTNTETLNAISDSVVLNNEDYYIGCETKQ